MSHTASHENRNLSPAAVAQGHSTSDAGARGMNRVVFLLSLSVFINYIDRSNLSIAAPLLQRELGISYSQLGVLLSAFFWPYALMQMPAGWLVDHFDVKWVFAAGFFLWSAATAVTGTLHGFAALIVIRVILGLGESIVFPSCSKILGTHFAEKRRGFANAILMAGLSLGPALGILFGGVVIGRFGWRPFFVTLGLASLLWLVPWLAWMPRRPRQSGPVPSHRMGYLHILRERSAWGTCLGQFSINYFLYFLVTWLPTYLVRGRGFSANDMAKAGSFVFFMSAISATVWGKLCDRWLNAGASLTSVRKSSMVLGHVGIGISLTATVFTHGTAFIAMLTLTGIFLGISVCNSWAIAQTLAGPLAAGRWTGLQNFIGNFAGWVAPALTGILVDKTGNYRWAFFITAGVAWVGALSWGWVVGAVKQCNWEKYAVAAQVGQIAAAGAAQP
jgi:ACS family D-galactonate transporter-like MFS transporter